MVAINLQDATVEFQVLSGRDKSLRRTLVDSVGGGRVVRGPRGVAEVKALDSLNLRVEPGERVGLMGSNGSGKTTLLRVLSRVYRPTSGIATIDGSITALSDIALGMNPEASGVKNIFLRGALLGMSKKEINAQLAEIIDFSGLGDFIDMPMRTYSTGMQMRLSFAVSTVIAPEIMIMDEWLAVGDEAFRDKAERRLVALIEDSKVLVLASHSRVLLEKMCTRGIMMDRGAILRDGPIGDVTAAYFGSESP
jgi:lipopolysaccharide transport system ATP-binding protein